MQPLRDSMKMYGGYGWRARIGFITPITNTVCEAEWNAMKPDGVTVHCSRIPLHTDHSTPAAVEAHERDLKERADHLRQAGVDIAAYCCTAGSMVDDTKQLTDLIGAAAGGVPSVTMAQSLIDALRALGARRVAVATPYGDRLNEHEREYLEHHQIHVVALEGLGFGETDPAEWPYVSRTPAEVVYRLARKVDRPEADAVLISCSDFPTLGVLPKLEEELGKPVVTSNQATLWSALRAAGLKDRLEAGGRLFEVG